MMLIESVTLEGFRSYKKRAVWSWPLEYGLYMLGGENKVDTSLQSNSAGKSSALEAIIWCFYGKTSRGLRGQEIVTWGGFKGTTRVEVNFVRRSRHYKVVRTVNPNTLTLDDSPVEQEEVTKALGVNYECFLFSAIIGQFSRYFLDLGSADKLNLFSFVLNLDYWLERSEKAKAGYDEAEARVEACLQSVAELEGRNEEITDQLACLEVETTQYERQRDQRLGELDSQLEGLLDKRGRQKSAASQLRLKAGKLSQDTKELAACQEKLRGSLQRASEASSEARAEVRIVADRIRAKMDEIEEIRNSAPKCSRCRQPVSKKHVRAEVERIRVGARRLRRKKSELELQQVDINVKLSKRKDELESVAGQLERKREKLNQVEASVRKAESQLQETLTEIKSAREGQRVLKKNSNPYKAQYGRALDAMRRVVAELKETKAALRDARQASARKKFWIRGFKDIRLSITDEVLRELEVETSNALEAIGLSGWNMTFEVERETKAGTIQRGLRVFVTPPGNEKPVRFECYAGGETQRLKIAGSIGMANLIAQRRGLDLQFECWDEPTKNMNPRGIDDLLSFFADRARLDGKIIFFIDQHVLDSGLFASVYRAVKDKNGSRIEMGLGT